VSTLRLRHVQAWVDKQGRVHQYFRKRGHPRVRLPGLPGSPEFMRAYEQAMSAPQAVGTQRNKPGSLSAAVALYLSSNEFALLAQSTKVMRRNLLERLREHHGDKPVAQMPRQFVTNSLSNMKPHAARNAFGALRALLQFGVEHGLCPTDMTQGIKLPRPKSDGHHTWSEEEIAQFEAHWAVGTMPRLAFALLLYTGQRRSDVLKMGRQHVRDGMIAVKQQKTGTPLAIPVHPDLQAAIDATPSGNLTLVVTERCEAFRSGANFSNFFRQWCDEAGLPKRCSAHGLRKACCRRLAEVGCSANEIAAISGHLTLKEVERYTRAADQLRLARNAMARVRTNGHGELSNSDRQIVKHSETPA
jgi:integrase